VCDPGDRIIALTAFREYLQREVDRPPSDGNSQDTLERHTEALQVVNEELAGLMADPHVPPPASTRIGAWSHPPAMLVRRTGD
jgi:hypothetical protein